MYDLNSVGTEELIGKIRNGVPVTLVCKKSHDGFSASSTYPVQKISMGSAIEVVDDFGELVMLDDEYPGADCFAVAESLDAVQSVSRSMKEESLKPLLAIAEQFITPNKFKVMDAVKWIPGLQVMNLPAIAQPAIVLEILDSPVVDEEVELGDPARSIKCDMMIGFMVDGQRMITVLADSRRFESYDTDLAGSD